ncbi:MAG: PEP-CTERM sorting domain-containing protein [Thiobacillus sp.]|nr:PEP-CTERM sorting domain-containing protein [Thiobacillus sp.]
MPVAALPPQALPPEGRELQTVSPAGAASNSIPEPASIVLMAVGLAGLLWMRRRHAGALPIRPR